MNKTSKKRVLIISISAFCFLYIFLALKPLGRELHFTPEWPVDISHVSEKQEDDVLLGYRLAQNVGYFTPDGKIVKKVTFPFKSSISDEYYTTFNADSLAFNYFGVNSDQPVTVEQPGFPFFDHDRLYVFLPGGTSFCQYSTDEPKRLWQYEYYAPVTAFSSSKGGTVAGFSDGTIVSFSPEGAMDQKFSPGGSDVGIILGVDISEDGKSIACVCGHKKQRFIVAEKKDGHSKVVFHEYLPEDSLEQVLVKFDEKNSYVYYAYKGGIGVVDIKKQKSSKIPIEGAILQLEKSASGKYMFILSRSGNKFSVTTLEDFDKNTARFDFDAEYAFIRTYENALFVGRNSKISRITISQK